MDLFSAERAGSEILEHRYAPERPVAVRALEKRVMHYEVRYTSRDQQEKPDPVLEQYQQYCSDH